MGRLLAVDFGTKRTGLAVTDPLKIIATPLSGVMTHVLFDFLTDYLQKEEVERLIVGWPTQDDGSPTNNTPHVEAFVNRFKKIFPQVPVDLQDEWNTSNMAMQTMIAGGVKKKKRRDKLAIDKLSAVLILQAYMESNL
ncbi:MAG: Holliday junction resolvase RuvX [Cyclobacteriaceae bacterium]